VPDTRLPWNGPPNLAGRPIDVLLPGVPALIGGATRRSGRSLSIARRQGPLFSTYKLPELTQPRYGTVSTILPLAIGEFEIV
jgi:hypothetical protein